MSLRYGYFDSEITGVDENGMPILDRAETSDLFRLLLANLVTNGVLANPKDSFQVRSRRGFFLTVRPGFAMIEGAFAYMDQDTVITISPSNADLPRYDAVVLRCDYRQRKVILDVVTGEPASSPQVPEPTRNSDLYEIVLAVIDVPKGSTSISAVNIDDKRGDSRYCGLITQAIDSIDTSVFFEQITAYFEDYKSRVRSAFDTWFDKIKAQLDTDQAGHLQREIDVLLEDFRTCIGNLGELNSKSKNNLVSAVNSVKADLDEITYPGSGTHNAIYRGKNLGSSVSDAQWKAISDGSFKDMYIGDYWVIHGYTWVILAFDYYYKAGDTECAKHHVTLMPLKGLYTAGMNATDTTDGGYVGSVMRRTGLDRAKTIISQSFGTHLLNHRNYFTNAVGAAGTPSAGAWVDSTVDLMTERNVYGNAILSSMQEGSDNLAQRHDFTLDRTQFRLFAFRPDLISNRGDYWLRDVVSRRSFAYISGYGYCYANGATLNIGVRPAFSIF